jgi:hypothetical protein
MKNPAPYLKRALATLLTGNVVYNTENIPYFEREGQLVPNQVIFMNDSYDGSESDKHNFRYRSSFWLDVVTIKNDPSSKLADQIAEIVMNLVKPDTRSGETLTGTDFQIMILGGPSLDPLREDSLSGEKVFRRLIKFNALLIER